MINDIGQAFLTKFNETPAGDALRAVLTGGLYFTQAKDNVSFPYGVYTFDGSVIDEIAGTSANALETATITVGIFHNADDGGTAIFNIIEEFIALYDWTVLTYPALSPYEHIKCSRMSIANRGIVDKIWLMEIDYEVQYSH